MDSFAVRKARQQTNALPPRSPADVPKVIGEGGKVVVIVDPYSTGCCVAQEALKRGYKLVVVWTNGIGENKTHVPSSCHDLVYYAEVNEKSSITETAIAVTEAARPFKVAACICGGESGVAYCDALSEKLGVLTNGTEIAERRDKKLQQELVKAAGLRSVRQAGGGNFSDVEEFLKAETFPVVVKPVESAGSDGVKLCHSFEEAKEHFGILMNSQQKVGGGGCHAAVLCQEFLRGKEYVVDHVSRDGVHKTVACWVYDKRPVNGAAFVYFGCVPIDSESEEAKIVIPYIRGVLDALGMKHGPSHGEVMMTDDGPCLVEMNCRAHGGDGNWIPLIRGMNGGYTQVSATIDAYMDTQQFDRLPNKMPSPAKASGQEVILVSYSRGKVKSTPGYDVLRNLPSFLKLETRIGPGSEVEYTTDLFTDIGSVILMHEDDEVVKKDINFLRYMEDINGYFLFETKQEILKRPRGDSVALAPLSPSKVSGPAGKKKAFHRRVFSSSSSDGNGPILLRHQSLDRPELRTLTKKMTTVDASKEAVIVVDPYSTGCCIAKEIMNRTYKVIAVWSKDITPGMMQQVPLSCSGLAYHAEVQEKGSTLETAAAIQQAAKLFRIVACVCGGKSGALLTDALSEKLGVRTNGTNLPQRLDKKLQHDLVKAAGLRAVRQAGGAKFSDVEEFLKMEHYPVVVKPTETVGSDGAKLCHNFEEAEDHFELLMAVQKGDNAAVVCQEFLRGREYIVDQVSRDGVHKTIMVWVHDKRPANGASFVYFGLLPVDSESPEAKLVISYARGVLECLGVQNGPTHTEVVMTDSGPCLVEMSSRAHGGDGNWQPLERSLNGGYTQVGATVDAYLDKQQFSIIPDKMPSPFKASGQEVILVSYSMGKVKSTPGFDVIKSLPSFVYFETGVRVGSEVDYTVDPFTSIGSVILVHEDKDVLQDDVVRIRQMEKNNEIFEYETGVEIMRSLSRGDLLSLSGLTISDTDRKQSFVSNRADLFW